MAHMAADTSKMFEGMDITQDEVKRISEALKNEEFRKLLTDYAEEISDPENRRRYEAEIAQMEAERGMDVQFVNPDPGYVLKTVTEGTIKTFINVCKSDKIGKPTSQRRIGSDGKSGMNWSLPYSFSPAREDVDKNSKKCMVYDFVIHPDTYRMAEVNKPFQNMVESTAFDGITKQFGVSVDSKNILRPKMKFKGTPTATVIRTKKSENDTDQDDEPEKVLGSIPYPYDKTTSAEKAENLAKEAQEKMTQKTKSKCNNSTSDEYTVPEYIIKHRNNFDLQNFRNAPDAGPSAIPDELVIDICLPLLKSANNVNLDIFQEKLLLKCSNPAKYKLDLKLPYIIDENNGSAKFDKSKKKLVVTLPVVKRICEDLGNRESDNLETVQNGQSSDQMHPGIIELPQKSANIPDQHEQKSVEDATATASEGIALDRKMNVHYTLPKFDVYQDNETVTFALGVKNVEQATLNKLPGDSRSFEVKMASMGSGGFPMHYALYVSFEEGCLVDYSASYTNISQERVVVVLLKEKKAVGLWEKFRVGVNKEHAEEREFLTDQNLKNQLDLLDEEHESGGSQDEATSPQLHVSDISNDALTLHITDQKDESASTSGDVKVEVVHDKELPKLQGILKQRTMSESSDDVFSGSFSSAASSRQNSHCESPIVESDESVDSNGMRKSVSFSEHVDHATFKSGQSVSSMKPALKSKRKKAKKQEQRQQVKAERQERRRRRSSGSYSELSSDDTSSHAESTEEHDSGDGAKKSNKRGKGKKNKGNQNKEVVVTEKGDSEREGEEVLVSAEVVVEEEKIEEGGESKEDPEVTIGFDKSVVVSDAVQNKINDEMTSNDKSVKSEVMGTSGEAVKKVIDASDNGYDSDDNAPGDKEAPAPKKKADTMLSWADPPAQKTESAFKFDNTVMYDLDLD